MSDWIMLLKMTIPFLCLFAGAEWLYHKQKAPAEITRKIVHTGTGLLTLLFPVVFQHLWQVLIICAAFLVLLLLSLRFRLLPSINAVERVTRGSILFPVIVSLIFAFYLFMKEKNPAFQPLIFFYLPILVMAIADPVAALSGNAYKRKKGGLNGKTIVGSVAFFVTAFMISFSLLYFFATITFFRMLLFAFAIAFATTVAERVSSKGWDNFTIPLTVAGLLYLMV